LDELADNKEIKQIEEESADQYYMVRRDTVARSQSNHRLLGHPANVQFDMHPDVQRVTNRLWSGSDDESLSRLTSEAADWILLLQIASDDDLGTCWGDAGNLYLWIRKQDLASRNFDNVWCIVQCY
jgi:uncharacterized protein YwqG